MPKQTQKRARNIKRRVTATRAQAAQSGGPAAETAVPDCSIDREEISRLAYSYWVARGGQHGSPEDDWLRAESELKARRARNQA